jgi:hypothetical protein
MAVSTKMRLQGVANTSGATPGLLIWTLPDGSTVTDIPIPENSAVQMNMNLKSFSAAGVVSVWKGFAAGKRIGAGAVALVGIPQLNKFADAGAVLWGLSPSGANGALSFEVSATLGSDVSWLAALELEIFGP